MANNTYFTGQRYEALLGGCRKKPAFYRIITKLKAKSTQKYGDDEGRILPQRCRDGEKSGRLLTLHSPSLRLPLYLLPRICSCPKNGTMKCGSHLSFHWKKRLRTIRHWRIQQTIICVTIAGKIITTALINPLQKNHAIRTSDFVLPTSYF